MQISPELHVGRHHDQFGSVEQAAEVPGGDMAFFRSRGRSVHIQHLRTCHMQQSILSKPDYIVPSVQVL